MEIHHELGTMREASIIMNVDEGKTKKLLLEFWEIECGAGYCNKATETTYSLFPALATRWRSPLSRNYKASPSSPFVFSFVKCGDPGYT